MMFPKPQKRRKSKSKAKQAALHLERVKQCPCVNCGRFGPSDAHHCRSDSFGSQRASDFATIPLCKLCHQVGELAFHNDKGGWEDRNCKDYAYIPEVLAMLGISTDTDF